MLPTNFMPISSKELTGKSERIRLIQPVCIIIFPFINHLHARPHQLLIYAIPDFSSILPLVDSRYNARSHTVVFFDLSLSTGHMGQHTITKGAQCLQLGACVWQSPCSNACGSEVAATIIIFIRAGSGILPIRLIVFVGVQPIRQ